MTWLGLAIVVAVPLAAAATSPLLAWRDPIYIASSIAGILAMMLVLVQPLLAGVYLPGLPARPGRRVHRWVGFMLALMVLAHVAGLWLTSPPDVIDALLFDSPTPFSVWGVVAMWAIFASAGLAALRGWLRIGPKAWRIGHTALAVIIVVGGVIHMLLIEGTMSPALKGAFCALVLAATTKVLLDLRPWMLLVRRKN